MYSAFFLWFISQSLLLSDVAVPIASAVAASLLLFQRIPAEEILLMREFSDAYSKYKAKTSKVIPRVY